MRARPAQLDLRNGVDVAAGRWRGLLGRRTSRDERGVTGGLGSADRADCESCT